MSLSWYFQVRYHVASWLLFTVESNCEITNQFMNFHSGYFLVFWHAYGASVYLRFDNNGAEAIHSSQKHVLSWEPYENPWKQQFYQYINNMFRIVLKHAPKWCKYKTLCHESTNRLTLESYMKAKTRCTFISRKYTLVLQSLNKHCPAPQEYLVFEIASHKSELRVFVLTHGESEFCFR